MHREEAVVVVLSSCNYVFGGSSFFFILLAFSVQKLARAFAAFIQKRAFAFNFRFGGQGFFDFGGGGSADEGGDQNGFNWSRHLSYNNEIGVPAGCGPQLSALCCISFFFLFILFLLFTFF
jgi:hypothetical protein